MSKISVHIKNHDEARIYLKNGATLRFISNYGRQSEEYIVVIPNLEYGDVEVKNSRTAYITQFSKHFFPCNNETAFIDLEWDDYQLALAKYRDYLDILKIRAKEE